MAYGLSIVAISVAGGGETLTGQLAE